MLGTEPEWGSPAGSLQRRSSEPSATLPADRLSRAARRGLQDLGKGIASVTVGVVHPETGHVMADRSFDKALLAFTDADFGYKRLSD